MSKKKQVMMAAVLPLIFAALALEAAPNVGGSPVLYADYSPLPPQALNACVDLGIADANASATIPLDLFINELMADNDAAVAGPKGTYPDWVELYNAGNLSIDLSGMYLTDDLANPKKWAFPNGTNMNPRDYLVIWADGYVGQGVLHASFTLKANGETIALFASDGTTLIDSVTYGKQVRDVSYGRFPDGASKWDYFTASSAGSANENASTAPSFLSAGLLVIMVIAIAALFRQFTKNNARRAQT
jgi:hypothetical protein